MSTNINKLKDFLTQPSVFKNRNVKQKLQILDTYHDFGNRVNEVLKRKQSLYYKGFEKDVRDILYGGKKNENTETTNIYEILDKLFEDEEENDRRVVVERSGKGGLTTLDSNHCFNTNILYTDIYSKANQYDDYAATERTDISDCVKYNLNDKIEICTKRKDGLLVIDNVKLTNNDITYEIDTETKTIDFSKKKSKFGSEAIKEFLETKESSIFTNNINKIFYLDYKDYKSKVDDRKKYIKCLFDFKRLGDLQLIKVAKNKNIPFITGDRLAAVIANYCYDIPSLFISSAAELYKNKKCTIYEKPENIVKYLLDLFDNDNDDDAKAKDYIDNIPKNYLTALENTINEELLNQQGGNPQDLPEQMNEDRWYYAVGLFKIIDEYLPRDNGTVGDNTVLLFQYMFLGYMYDLHDEDVIDYVKEYLKSSSIEQSATDYATQAKQVQTFQPDIPEKVKSPYNIQQSVSKDTQVYNDDNSMGDTATSTANMGGGKQNTTKFMKNVIKDFKKLFV
jgi:hypothetical protein